MDVVLLKDVEKLGTEGAVVNVKPGFARNYLLPRGLAVAATPQQLRAVEASTRRRAQRTARAQADAVVLKQQIERRAVSLPLTIGADEKPFGSVTAHDIMEALKREGIEIEKPSIQLEQPIKALGVYEVPVRVHADVVATLKLQVIKA